MWILLGAVLIPLVQQAAPAYPPLPVPIPCSIDAWLDSPGGRIEFKLSVKKPRPKQTTPTFAVLSGIHDEDLIWIERWEMTPAGLSLNIDSYDSHLQIPGLDAKGQVQGVWRKLRGPNDWVELPLHGIVRTETVVTNLPPPPWTIDGRWAVTFSSSKEPAVGVFAHPEPGRVSGTFLTTLGDYRYLAGAYDASNDRWQLSCFDGAHAFLFTAKKKEDGTLGGEFWSGDKVHETWTAKRDEHAALADPFGLTTANAKVDLAKLIFTAVDGTKLSLADAKFAGKPRLIQVFGTWCPNCNDEAVYLCELDRTYRPKGLSIVGLGFEISGDEARDLGQLQLFATRHKVEYPLLLAGKSDKVEASKAFPLLDAIRAFPTTIFMRADGSVLAVHQGYCGPATGLDHRKMREDFERLIGELLSSQKPKAR